MIKLEKLRFETKDLIYYSYNNELVWFKREMLKHTYKQKLQSLKQRGLI